MHHKEKILLVTGDSEPGIPSRSSGSLCGLQVLASTYPALLDAKWKQTTIGGVLKIDQRYYCLTVAHAFHLQASEARDGDLSSGSSGDSDDDFAEWNDFVPAPHPKSFVSVIACPPHMIDGVGVGLYLDHGAATANTRARVGETDRAPLDVDQLKVIGAGGATLATNLRLQSILLCTELDWDIGSSDRSSLLSAELGASTFWEDTHSA